MNCTDWNEKLSDHLDGTLAPADTAALEAHLATCPACRAELAALRALRAATKNLPRQLDPPRDFWPEIESRLTTRRMIFSAPFLFKLAAGFALLFALAAAWKWRTSSAASTWQIAALAGAPRVDSQSFQGESHLRVGQWLETDPASRAKVSVGAIGEVHVEPNSRVRLVATSATDHRLELARGQLTALIWAPPRLFFVDTPSATAVDLGCAYTMTVADDGDGTLRVTSGYVALQHAGRESIIPAGQMCLTRRGAGPGTPFAADAPPALRRALERFDFESAAAALHEILASARTADAVTLFHLLNRTAGAARGEVFDTLARDHAPPAAVTRAGILAGDKTMFAQWAAALGLVSFSKS